MVMHEGENLHKIKMFNLQKEEPKPPNSCSIFVNGELVETWKTVSTARYYLHERVKFLRKHSVAGNAQLFENGNLIEEVTL